MIKQKPETNNTAKTFIEVALMCREKSNSIYIHDAFVVGVFVGAGMLLALMLLIK